MIVEREREREPAPTGHRSAHTGRRNTGTAYRDRAFYRVFPYVTGVGLQTSTAGTGKGRRMYEYRERESNGRKGYQK